MSITMKNRHFKKHSDSRGFTLLEAMIALVIFSIGLIGLAGLQSASMSFNHSAYLRSQATFLAYNILDQMRANHEAARNNTYNATFASVGVQKDCLLGTVNCTFTEMAQNDIYQWKQNVLELLPKGEASVQSNGANPPVFTITVQWDDINSITEKSSITLRSEL